MQRGCKPLLQHREKCDRLSNVKINSICGQHISAGIIVKQGLVLLCRRRDGAGVAGLWEFPGGKREAGETAEACLLRECREELDISLRVGPVFAAFDWAGASDRRLRFTFLWAEIEQGEPRCIVHDAVRWVCPGRLSHYALCPADASIADSVAAALSSNTTDPTEEWLDAEASLPGTRQP